MTSIQAYFILLVHTSLLSTNAATPCTDCDSGNVTCVDGVCQPRCINETSSGACLQCRDYRFYGKQCQTLCPHTCLNSRCQLTNSRVVCTEGCVAGKKGDNCDVNCLIGCIRCQRYDNICTGPCKEGYYGKYCQFSCSSTCEGECEIESGTCIRCKFGYMGSYCDEKCPPNCTELHRLGCAPCTLVMGTSEGRCSKECPANCSVMCTGKSQDKDTRDIEGVSSCTDCDGGNVTCVDGVCLPRCVNGTSSGECLECRDSRFYGERCENICSHTCLNYRCQLNNSRVVCTEGCVAGKKGDDCGVNCPTSCTQCDRYGDKCVGLCYSPQYYGDYCDKPCPSGCRDGCDKDTEECDNCVTGHRGRYCNDTCPINCRDGCDLDTGQCDSCRSGYRGRSCNDTCLMNCTDGCNRDTAECNNASSGYRDTALKIWPTLLAIVVTCIIIFLASHLWKRRQRRKSPEIVISLLDNYSLMNNTLQVALNPCDISTSTPSLKILNPTYMLTVGGADVLHVKMCDDIAGEEAMDQMIAEFYKLPKPDIRPVKHGSLEENFAKNRYRDVLPFDETRVTLETDEDEDSDYINASYINAYGNQTRHVAAQGPSFHDVDDFWRMIWQLETTKIVMLTNLVEAEKVKCEMYWPNCSDTEKYGKVCVKCVGEEVYEDCTLRTLAVWKGTFETRTVRQFHFTAWPDHGVPEESKSIIAFHRVVKETGPNTLGPIVIHCSAGIGRTGTFLAFDYLMDQARHEDSVCVYKCVKDMRLQRMKIVQTKMQYKFLYTMLFNALQYILPRTVHVVCERCWDKEDNSERNGDDLSMEINHDEYESLWDSETSQSINLLADVCVTLDENNPDLFKPAIMLESTDIQLESTDIQMESADIQMESTDIQMESADIQMESADIQMNSTDTETEPENGKTHCFVVDLEKMSI